jgi:PIN domain nuclease of toxin-antitoxin system
MKFLLDSHTLLWTVYEPHRLSGPVSSILEDTSSDILISYASIWI